MNDRKHTGDRGMTTLFGSGMVAKTDERIVLIGEVEELICHIRLMRTEVECPHFRSVLERIAGALGQVNDSVRVQFHREPLPKPEEIQFLEQEMQRLETEIQDQSDYYSENKLSAELRLVCAVARRAERALIAADRRFGMQAEAKQYLNRLSDYFEIAARYQAAEGGSDRKISESGTANTGEHELMKSDQYEQRKAIENKVHDTVSEQVQQAVRQVLHKLGGNTEVTLSQAKVLIEAIEQEAEKQGVRAVISVCSAHGNPVAVHVMDGAFLLSFDVAVKKAYTAAAVKMPTLDLAKLAAPGQTFYGVDKLDGGRITVIGGGVPLMRDGVLYGAVGVSGGTGEEDHALALKAVDMFVRM